MAISSVHRWCLTRFACVIESPRERQESDGDQESLYRVSERRNALGDDLPRQIEIDVEVAVRKCNEMLFSDDLALNASTILCGGDLRSQNGGPRENPGDSKAWLAPPHSIALRAKRGLVQRGNRPCGARGAIANHRVVSRFLVHGCGLPPAVPWIRRHAAAVG
jgi:hypothetical protein